MFMIDVEEAQYVFYFGSTAVFLALLWRQAAALNRSGWSMDERACMGGRLASFFLGGLLMGAHRQT
jgi:hypothetical protein